MSWERCQQDLETPLSLFHSDFVLGGWLYLGDTPDLNVLAFIGQQSMC